MNLRHTKNGAIFWATLYNVYSVISVPRMPIQNNVNIGMYTIMRNVLSILFDEQLQ